VVWALALVVSSVACTTAGAPLADDERVLGAIETNLRLAILVEGEGLIESLQAQLSVAPKDPVLLTLRGELPSEHADEGLNGAVVEFELGWTDFEGTRPTSYGGSYRRVLPFGPDGAASKAAPLLRSFPFQLPAPDPKILARRVTLWARFHPLDLEAGAVHTGGATLVFERVARLSVRAPGTASLSEVLADEQSTAGELFLAAVSGGDDAALLEPRLEQLVAVLPGARGSQREAIFGALQCLTGQTNGRNVYRWQAWWRERQEPDDT